MAEENMGATEVMGELTQPRPFRVFETKEDWQKEIDGLFAERFKKERIEQKRLEASKEERLNARIESFKEELSAFLKKRPEVNLKEVATEEFLARIKKGYSIEDAHTLTKGKDNFCESAPRPRENGAKTAPMSLGRADVSSMSSKDFALLLEEVRKGKVIK